MPFSLIFFVKEIIILWFEAWKSMLSVHYLLKLKCSFFNCVNNKTLVHTLYYIALNWIKILQVKTLVK